MAAEINANNSALTIWQLYIEMASTLFTHIEIIVQIFSFSHNHLIPDSILLKISYSTIKYIYVPLVYMLQYIGCRPWRYFKALKSFVTIQFCWKFVKESVLEPYWSHCVNFFLLKWWKMCIMYKFWMYDREKIIHSCNVL